MKVIVRFKLYILIIRKFLRPLCDVGTFLMTMFFFSVLKAKQSSHIVNVFL